MRRLVLSLFSLLLVQHVFSQIGTLDLTYGNGGASASFPKELNPYSFAVAPDGKIAVVGTVDDPSSYLLAAVVRYTANGAVDKTFRGSGFLIEPDLNAAIFGLGVAVQKDGKVLVAGIEGGAGSGEERVAVYRYNQNGTHDETFGGGDGKTAESSGGFVATGSGPEIAVLSDGKIVVVATYGEAGSFSGKVTIFNPDGTISDSYSIHGLDDTDNDHVYLSAYPDGGGYVLSYAVDDATVAINSTRFGTKTFAGGNGGFRNRHTILNNGRVAFLSESNGKTTITLLKADGTPDVSFSGDGVRELSGFDASSITSDAKGRIILQGFRTGTGNYNILRLNRNGSIDTGFGDNGFVRLDYTGPLAVYGNRLFAVGSNNIGAYILYTDPRYVKVNLFAGVDPIASSEWNNWNNLRSLHYNNFYYSDSTISTIDAVLSARNGVNDNGSSYVGGMAPPRVLRHSSQNTGTRTLTLSGLTVSKRYSIELYASRNANTTDTTVFTVDGVSQKVGTYRNNTNRAVFTNLAPNAQGQIVITISSTKMYNYLNGFTLTESFASMAPAMDNSLTLQKKGAIIAEGSDLQLVAYPNPSRQSFTLQVKGSTSAPLQVRVFDAAGRVVETKQNVGANTTLTLGSMYRAGVYYVETVQGTERSLTKLVKLAN